MGRDYQEAVDTSYVLPPTVQGFVYNLKEHLREDAELDPGFWCGTIEDVDDGPEPGTIDVLYQGIRITLKVMEVATPSR